eukprot:325044-Pleurochrysis_carterae.AAC.1
MWDGGTVDEFPASVALVVGDFRSFGGRPAVSIVAKSLLASFGVGVSGGCKHCGSGWNSGIAHGEQGSGCSVAER